LPFWLAVMVQLPTLNKVRVLPFTPPVVHTLGVPELNTTASPEVAVATKLAAGVPRVWLPGELKLMLCTTGAALTMKVIKTGAAAL
jgi:hypothetical protein